MNFNNIDFRIVQAEKTYAFAPLIWNSVVLQTFYNNLTGKYKPKTWKATQDLQDLFTRVGINRQSLEIWLLRPQAKEIKLPQSPSRNEHQGPSMILSYIICLHKSNYFVLYTDYFKKRYSNKTVKNSIVGMKESLIEYLCLRNSIASGSILSFLAHKGG